MKPIWWIIIAVVALIVIWLVARAASSRKAEADRVHAEEMRSEAQVHDRELRERQAAADEADAAARKAQAEADESNARARQLQAEAERRGEAAHEVRTNRDHTLRQADALDPDVRTDKEGYRLDEDGNRLDDGRGSAMAAGAGAAGVGAAGAAGTTDGMWTDRRDETTTGRDSATDDDAAWAGDRVGDRGDSTDNGNPDWSEGRDRSGDSTTNGNPDWSRDGDTTAAATGTTGEGWDRDRDTTLDNPRGATAERAYAGSADRDGDGDVGLDDRVENRVDGSIGRDDPTRNDVGDGHDDATVDDEHRSFGDRLRDKADDVRGRDVDGDGRRG